MSTLWASVFSPPSLLMLGGLGGVMALWWPARTLAQPGSPASLALAWLSAALGLHPVINALAQHALWLHAAQMLLLHHIVPRLWWQGLHGAQARWQPCAGGSAAVFGGLSVVWMLPPVHPWLMRSAEVYAAMNLSMLLSGLWWMLGPPSHRPSRPRAASLASRPGALMSAVLPQALLGLWLLTSAPRYLVDMDLCVAAPHPDLAAWQRQVRLLLSPAWDQGVAGGLFLLGAFWPLRGWRPWPVRPAPPTRWATPPPRLSHSPLESP